MKVKTDNKEKIILNKSLEGYLVFAKPKPEINSFSEPWLILIGEVEERKGSDGYVIQRHVSYGIRSGVLYIDDKLGYWGSTFCYLFFKPTEEQKKFMAEQIKKAGYKYIRILNKLVKLDMNGRNI